MTEVGRPLWRSYGLTSPAQHKATHSQLPRTISRQFLNISNDGDLSNSLGNPCQCSINSRKVLPLFRGNLLGFSMCPLPRCCHWALLKRAWLPCICALPSVFIHIDEITPSLLFSRMKNPGSLSLSSQEMWSSPSSSCHFAGLSSLAPFLSCAGEPRTGHSATGVMKITK